MIVKLLLVDACTDGLFSGGTAAVAFLRHLGQEVFLQGLADELGFPVTAYVIAHQDEFITRSFAPQKGETDGHSFAALAVAHAIYEAGLAPVDKPIVLHGRGGALELFKTPAGAVGLHLNPAQGSPAPPEAAERLSKLGLAPADLLKAEYLGPDRLLVYCRTMAGLEAVDFQRLREAFPQTRLTFSAPLDSSGADTYVVRAFSADSKPENVPMNLSVQAALGPFWAGYFKKPRLEIHYISPRTPRLWIETGAGGQLSLSAQVNTVFRADPVLKELSGDIARNI